MILYRAVSKDERDNFRQDNVFRTGRNTIEAKQFFKSIKAIKQFVASSRAQQFYPAYEFLLIISADNKCLKKSNQIEISLDGFDAITIEEDDLITFSNCANFVKEELL